MDDMGSKGFVPPFESRWIAYRQLNKKIADLMQDESNVRYSYVDLIRHAFSVCGYEGSNEHCTLRNDKAV
jgi:hypothetical protein